MEAPPPYTASPSLSTPSPSTLPVLSQPSKNISTTILIWTALYQASSTIIFIGFIVAMFALTVQNFNALASDFSEPVVFVFIIFFLMLVMTPYTIWQLQKSYRYQLYHERPVTVGKFLASFYTSQIFEVYGVLYFLTIYPWMWVMIGNGSQVNWSTFHQQFIPLSNVIFVYAITLTVHFVFVLCLFFVDL